MGRRFLRDWDHIDLVFAEAEGGFERFDQARTIRLVNLDPILDDRHAATKSFNFIVGIDPNNFVIEPDPQITLLLDEIEELAWFSVSRNCDPERD